MTKIFRLIQILLITSTISLPAFAQNSTESLIFGGTANLGVIPLIAKNQGFFTSNGVQVEYKKFQTGKMTMDSLISGDTEIGTIVDSNAAFINFSNNPLKIIASIGYKLDDTIWYKNGLGISQPKDLIGKKIGYTPATTSHVFLARFLEHHQVDWSSIKPVILQPPAMEAALRNGTVDAVSIWQPWGINITTAFKNEIGFFKNEQSIYPSRILLATTDSVLANKPEAIKKVIASLKNAIDFYRDHPEDTYKYLSSEIGTSAGTIPTALEKFFFKITLDTSVLSLISEIGNWIQKSQEDFKNLPVPDYSKAMVDGYADSEISTATKNQTTQTVRFCRPNNMVSALLYIAEAKDFFKAQGIEAKFEAATNAKICQDILVARGADYMTGADGPWTYLAASNPPLKILAMIQRNPETSIFARKDRGIQSFHDLKGKRVAYLPGTVSYFFLGRVLQKYGLSKNDIKLTAMEPPTMPTALIGGSIDAFSMWEPWGAQAETGLKDNLINLTDTDLYQYEALFTAHQDAINSHPEITTKILSVIIQAENFIRTNNQAAFDILSKSIQFEARAFKRLWPQYSHNVRLETAPIKLMEDNFKLLKKDDENFKDLPIPDFSSFVEDRFLRQLAPERVHLDSSNP